MHVYEARLVVRTRDSVVNLHGHTFQINTSREERGALVGRGERRGVLFCLAVELGTYMYLMSGPTTRSYFRYTFYLLMLALLTEPGCHTWTTDKANVSCMANANKARQRHALLIGV